MNEALAEQLERLPRLLAPHVLLVAGSLATGVLVSLPLSLLCARFTRLAAPVLALASLVQTIPALALLALMAPLLGSIGVLPAFLALVIYSVMPIARNAITGLREVDPALIEAARGVGMSEGQVLLRVRAPLALPTMLAGLRTATVWTVGLATLSTPVGARSLGNFIFSGLQTQNFTAVLVGCVAAAGLALALDALLALVEQAWARRRPALALVAGAVLASGTAWAALREEPWRGGPAPLRIGAKTFTEQYILARCIATQLEREGRAIELVESLGSTVAFDALVQGDIDVYVDYSGTLWANYMKRSDTPGAARVLAEVSDWLAREHGVECLGPLGFENAYAMALPRERAIELGIDDVGDLVRHAPNMTLGGDYEFFARPEWAALRDRYGLGFKDRRSFDPSLMFRAVEMGEVDVLAAFSSDGRIAAYDLVVLDEPLEVLPPYDAVLLVSARVAADPAARAALLPLIGAIDSEAMRRANMQVDVEGQTVEAAAALLVPPTRPPAQREVEEDAK